MTKHNYDYHQDNQYSYFGDHQQSNTLDSLGSPDIQVHTLQLDDIPEASNIVITEAYAGTVVGQGSAWQREYSIVNALIIARSVQFDYLLALDALS